MEGRDLQTVGLVAMGGASGAVARWVVSEGVPWDGSSLPVATLTVNLAGCLAIGVLLTLWTEGPAPRWWVRPLVAVGFVGGFTTYSAFAVESVLLLDAGAAGTALGYIAVSVVAGLVLVRLAGDLTRRWVGPARGGVQ